MTEPLEPPELDPADLAASAALDGETETAGAPRSATLDAARVAAATEQFRQVSAEVAAGIVPPPTDVRDAQLVAALAAALGDDASEAAGDETAVAPPVPLASRRAHRSRRWLAVAAAVAVVALAIPFVNAIRHQSSSSSNLTASATGASESVEPPGDEAKDPGAQSFAVSGSSTTSAPTNTADSTASNATPHVPATTPDLGAASTPQELVSLVETADPELTAAPPPSTTTTASIQTQAGVSAAACDHSVRTTTAGLGDLVLATTATFRGTAVDVLVYTVTDSTGAASGYRLLAVSPADCAVLVDQPL